MKITIRVTDQTGHTETEFTDLGLAVDAIIKEHFDNGRWAYVGATPFQFSANSVKDQTALLTDTARLRELLTQTDEVDVTITGSLVGGADIDRETLKAALNESLTLAVETVVDRVINAASENEEDESDGVEFTIDRADLDNLPVFVGEVGKILNAARESGRVLVRVVN